MIVSTCPVAMIMAEALVKPEITGNEKKSTIGKRERVRVCVHGCLMEIRKRNFGFRLKTLKKHDFFFTH